MSVKRNSVLCMTVAGVVKPSPAACEKPGRFLCHPDGRCLSNSSMCNGVVDCSDGSDELHCRGMNSGNLAELCSC